MLKSLLCCWFFDTIQCYCIVFIPSHKFNTRFDGAFYEWISQNHGDKFSIFIDFGQSQSDLFVAIEFDDCFRRFFGNLNCERCLGCRQRIRNDFRHFIYLFRDLFSICISFLCPHFPILDLFENINLAKVEKLLLTLFHALCYFTAFLTLQQGGKDGTLTSCIDQKRRGLKSMYAAFGEA